MKKFRNFEKMPRISKKFNNNMMKNIFFKQIFFFIFRFKVAQIRGVLIFYGGSSMFSGEILRVSFRVKCPWSE